MPERPYTVLSCAMSLDGYCDSADEDRLVLSNAADLDRVDAVRARCDAILVGAGTVRADNPRLVLRDPRRVARRTALGRPPSPWKVTVTERVKLDPESAFFTVGSTDKLVYCHRDAVETARDLLGDRATVVDAGRPVRMRAVCEDLHARGVRLLMVEGGGTVITQFLAGDLVDELQLVVAPMFVGDSRACRLVGDGPFPWDHRHRARLLEARALGDVVLLRYALSDRCPDVPGGLR